MLLTSLQNHLSTFLFSCQQSYKKYDHIVEEHTCTIPKILHTQRKVTLQNHSINLVRRDPWWLLVQCSGHSRLLMAMSSSDLSISKEWHVYNLPEQPILVLYHSHGEKRFPWISSEIPMFQLEAVDSHPNTTHLEKEPGCFISKPSHKRLKTIHQDPPRKTNKQTAYTLFPSYICSLILYVLAKYKTDMVIKGFCNLRAIMKRLKIFVKKQKQELFERMLQ